MCLNPHPFPQHHTQEWTGRDPAATHGAAISAGNVRADCIYTALILAAYDFKACSFFELYLQQFSL